MANDSTVTVKSGDSALAFQELPLFEVVIRLAVSELLPMPFLFENALYMDLSPEFSARYRSYPVETFGRACLPIEDEASRSFELFKQTGKTRVGLVVQRNLLAVQWYSPPFNSSQSYPGFTTLTEYLDRFLASVRKAPGTNSGVSFRAVNVMYSNYIQSEEAATVRDVSKYVKKKYLLAAVDGGSLLHEQNACWKEPGGVDYRLHLRAASGFTDFGWEICCSAGLLSEEPQSDPHVSLDLVHSLLLKRFEDLITPKAEKEWGLKR